MRLLLEEALRGAKLDLADLCPVVAHSLPAHCVGRIVLVGALVFLVFPAEELLSRCLEIPDINFRCDLVESTARLLNQER